jgi:quercetin dioxygenase-like cupin family protein
LPVRADSNACHAVPGGRLGDPPLPDPLRAQERDTKALIPAAVWLSVAEHASTKVAEVEVICSDAVQHRRRVETRRSDLEELKLPEWQDIIDREYQNWNRPHIDQTKRQSTKGIQKMEIKRSGSQPSGKGPAEYFTGTVRVDPLFQAKDPARALGASVTFEPGARTAWHTHPLGQTLIVTAGCGRVQRWGGPIEEIRPGDVVRIAPGEKHWHGATPTTAMTHIAIQEQLDDGKAVDWMEKVSDEQYQA